MAIHHATRTRAEKHGVIMTEQDGVITALWAEGNRRADGADAKQTLDVALLMRALGLEYPKWQISCESGVITVTVGEIACEWDVGKRGASVPSLADVVLAITEQAEADGVDITDEQEDEPEDDKPNSGSIVPERYRAKYAELGHPQNCGDWLAVILEAVTHHSKGFDPEVFRDILALNGVDLSKPWAQPSDARGHAGRFRMTGRNMLSVRVAISGVLRTPGEDIPVPADVLVHLRAKHRKAVERAGVAAPSAATAGVSDSGRCVETLEMFA